MPEESAGPARALPDDVRHFVATAFAAADREAALALLATARIHDETPASPRLLRCALLAADGSLARLRIEVGHLRVDYRDVILAGEYILREGRAVRVRDLNEPIAGPA